MPFWIGRINAPGQNPSHKTFEEEAAGDLIVNAISRRSDVSYPRVRDRTGASWTVNIFFPREEDAIAAALGWRDCLVKDNSRWKGEFAVYSRREGGIDYLVWRENTQTGDNSGEGESIVVFVPLRARR